MADIACLCDSLESVFGAGNTFCLDDSKNHEGGGIWWKQWPGKTKGAYKHIQFEFDKWPLVANEPISNEDQEIVLGVPEEEISFHLKHVYPASFWTIEECQKVAQCILEKIPTQRIDLFGN